MIAPLSDWARKTLEGKVVVASVSGGKDSAALSLWLNENGIEHRRIHMVTGWDAPETMDYIRGDLTRALGPIEEIVNERYPGGMVELIEKKGAFPSRMMRFCTDALKVVPLQKYIKALRDAGHDVVNCVGIRHGESAARAKQPEWEWHEKMDCLVWRPLVAWTLEDVVSLHTKHGLLPSPLYLRGHSRVGCYPCALGTKKHIRQVADQSPERIDLIRDLEARMALPGAARSTDKGMPPPKFFQAKTGGGECWPIDEVVLWSRTARGGRQFELFAPEAGDEGCLTWGLCGIDEDDAALGGGE